MEKRERMNERNAQPYIVLFLHLSKIYLIMKKFGSPSFTAIKKEENYLRQTLWNPTAAD